MATLAEQWEKLRPKGGWYPKEKRKKKAVEESPSEKEYRRRFEEALKWCRPWEGTVSKKNKKFFTDLHKDNKGIENWVKRHCTPKK